MQKIWKIKGPNPQLQSQILKDLKISPLLAGLLINRGINSCEQAYKFLNPTISSLHEPKLLTDIVRAKERILKALQYKEKVLVFSDYDADGLTSLAIIKSAFDKIGVNSRAYIPHRLKEGYGLSANGLRYAIDNHFGLVLTLDCGISNFQEIEHLRRSNIDTIVIDHHHLHSEGIPSAYAVINPKRKDCAYPYKDLSGAGLSYKFASFILNEPWEEALDLSCLGTIADVVPLLEENRIIVKEGLKRLNITKRPGLRALIEKACVSKKAITAETVSYILAPRINACGRIDSAEPALELLLCDSDVLAEGLADELQDKNRQRQRVESRIINEAINKIDMEIDLANERVIVLYDDSWHQGVLGIVAAKISDRFYRPAIVLSFSEGLGKGSGRSIEGFHLFEGLKASKEHLRSFGGHKKACGLSILKDKIQDFKDSINNFAASLSPEDLIPGLSIDFRLKLSQLEDSLLRDIALLEPFGQGNPKPVFASYNLKLKSRPVLLAKDTLKFWVTDGNAVYSAVGFGKGRFFDLVNSNDTINLAYKISRDDWNGNNQLQLEIEDINLP